MQRAIHNRQESIGRNQVNMIGAHGLAVLDMTDWHQGMASEQFRHVAVAGRIKMRDHDKAHTAVRRYAFEQFGQRGETAGRRADGHDGKPYGGSCVGRRRICKRNVCSWPQF